MASDAAGNFVVVWQSSDGFYNGVFGQRYASTGTPLGPEFRVNTYTTRSQGNPAVASDSSGNFVVVWGSSYQDGSLVGVFGTQVQLANGGRANIDEAYLRESILNPQAKIVQGYQPLMPTYQGQISEDALISLLAYIKSLGAKAPDGAHAPGAVAGAAKGAN